MHSADLTQVLRLDPRGGRPARARSPSNNLGRPGGSLDDLQNVALTSRPELASQRALVQAAETRLRREKNRPLLPIAMINGFQTPGGMLLQAGIFGLGANNNLNQWTGRDDVSFQLIWQLEGFGIGNLARIRKQRGDQSAAFIELFKTQDKVAAEVTETLARVQSAAARVSQAERALRASTITFNANLEGLGQTTRFGDNLQLVFRAQEVVYALGRMKTAFDEYFTTVAEYNQRNSSYFTL